MTAIRISCIALLFAQITSYGQVPPLVFEESGGKETPTYQEGIDWFTEVAKNYDYIDLQTFGMTDAGLPLHVCLIDKEKNFSIAPDDKVTLFINNAIHPGEPDGIDASMLLLRDLVSNVEENQWLNQIRVVIIPFFNVGGALNRNSFSRANQEGPESYGFRGNARYLDLNRDFAKLDTRNAQSFATLFTSLMPELYLETHVSNGADYQYTLTLLPTVEEKLNGEAGQFFAEKMLPALFERMEESGESVSPYVNVWGSSPEEGWNQFFDSPRYSTGYASLWSTIGMMTEAHMLKPFEQRVEVLYLFLKEYMQFAYENAEQIMKVIEADRKATSTASSFPISWEIDMNRSENFEFRGYASRRVRSEVTGEKRLYYDHDDPYEKEVELHTTYRVTNRASRPDYYVIPAGWYEVIDRLEANQVEITQLISDTSLTVQTYRLSSVQHPQYPYEGHYPHNYLETEPISFQRDFRKGDWIIPMNQVANRFIVEMLEPQAKDSYFRWNFFDAVMQRKEGYSAYVFEDLAVEILKEDPDLAQKLDKMKEESKTFRNDAFAQLNFIYENSKYAEPEFMIYPVFKVLK